MTLSTAQRIFPSPVGPLRVITTGTETGPKICGLEFCRTAVAAQPVLPALAELLAEAESQLVEYFAGERRAFDLPVHQDGTCFQRRVWRELARIPYGETISLLELARRVDASARAVEQANICNPIAILIPCHRVVAPNGKPAGLGGGLSASPGIRARLLEHERAVLAAEPPATVPIQARMWEPAPVGAGASRAQKIA